MWKKVRKTQFVDVGKCDDDVGVSPHAICPLLDIYTANDAHKSDNAIE